MPSQTRLLVLGAGRVGSAIALDLAADSAFEVSVADRDADRAKVFPADSGVRFLETDLGDAAGVQELVAPFDLVVGAVPGWMGFQTLEAVLKAGKNAVDISFFEEDPFELDELAREQGLTAIVDCGVAPGLGNLVLGRMEQEFERIDSFTCLVGGLPENPTPPWNYKAPYSPTDVIEMYTRPARLLRDGKVVTVPPLTEPEDIDFPGVGLLNAFNTDGLRSLLHTTSIPNLTEKTLRYPGNREQLELLASSGFFDQEREVNGELVRPLEVTSKLLFEQWHQGPTDYDVTVMRLVFEGQRDGKSVRRTFDLCDYFDRERGISSMARTTGYPCAAVVRLVANGSFARPGIVPPEFIGPDADCYAAILRDLEERGVVLKMEEVVLQG